MILAWSGAAVCVFVLICVAGTAIVRRPSPPRVEIGVRVFRTVLVWLALVTVLAVAAVLEQVFPVVRPDGPEAATETGPPATAAAECFGGAAWGAQPLGVGSMRRWSIRRCTLAFQSAPGAVVGRLGRHNCRLP